MKSAELAPIVLFTYRRLETLMRTVVALQQNRLASASVLHIFSDAAKGNFDEVDVAAVREYINSVSGFLQVIIHESAVNKGLACSIIEGVSEIIDTHGKVIVLEDDLVTSPNFLNFMNLALETYAESPQVFSISGYGLKVAVPKDYEYDVYFSPRGMSWGWATWNNRWNVIDWKIEDYKEFITSKKQKKRFSVGGSDLNDMLKKQIEGKIDSWAIRWYYHQFKNNQFTAFPIKSKVINLGFDDLATHTNAYNRYDISFDKTNREIFKFPVNIEVNLLIFKSFKKYFSISTRIFYGRLISPIFRFKNFVFKK